MSTSTVTSRTAAAERVSLGAVLGERNIWLLFVLGFCVGFPGTLSWINLFPRLDLNIDRTLLLALASFGISSWLALIAAPFLDRFRAPLFAGLSHRRSWVILFVAAALVVIALHLGTSFASQRASLRYAAISGILAFPISALLWIAIDALRIDLYRGRTQAVALAAQYLGALTASALAARVTIERLSHAEHFLIGALLAIALVVVLIIREPPLPAPVHAEIGSSSVLATVVRPWRTFFARHGRASGLLIAAIAFYALAASAAEYLGKQGYILDILAGGRLDYDRESGNALDALSTQEITLFAIGAVVGLLIAFNLAPTRAFSLLLYAYLGLVGLFLGCKQTFGFTVFTVAGLFALRSLLAGAAYVIFATIAARLTMRPHTAGQYMILGLASGLFWISETGFGVIGPLIGSYALAAGAAVAGIAAIMLMRLAARVAMRSSAIDRA